MPRRRVQQLDARLRLREYLWVAALLVVGFADVIFVQFVAPLLGR